MVARHGRIEAERYFNGDRQRSLRDVRSVTKSITATLVGMAIRQGLLTGLDEPIAKLLPPGMPAEQQRIRVRDLLTMRSGLDSDDDDAASRGNEDRLDASPAWIPFAYAVPMKHVPGERYVYSSLNAFLAGAVVEHVSGLSLERFAEEHLFGPLGITDFSWRRGPQGEGVGQGNLSISARDLVKIGDLFLNEGRVGPRQILDRAWAVEALSPLVDIAGLDPYADGYGYMWYTKRYDFGGQSTVVHFASGNGGNKIYVVPGYDLVVAITSTAYGKGMVSDGLSGFCCSCSRRRTRVIEPSQHARRTLPSSMTAPHDALSEAMFGSPRRVHWMHEHRSRALEAALEAHRSSLRGESPSALTVPDLVDLAALPNGSIIRDLLFDWNEVGELSMYFDARCDAFGIVVQQQWIFDSQDPYIWIDAVRITPSGTGVGSRLILHQVDRAHRAGVRRLTLLALEPNTRTGITPGRASGSTRPSAPIANPSSRHSKPRPGAPFPKTFKRCSISCTASKTSLARTTGSDWAAVWTCPSI
ncbi:MAG: serine hydrolase [Pleurocapsa sp. SU_196_0]|nr:serine hydrolase [Pleurocapsa sp. SU_196_0]